MPATCNPRILCVDDEANVLEGLRRLLGRVYRVVGVTSAEAALPVLTEGEPFAVVIADLRLGGMSGIRFLERAQALAPTTVRVLLSGQADLDAAMHAVNEGHIFQFLWKPCPPLVLMKAMRAAVEQHRLVTAERELLEQTLLGCVRALTEILAIANPAAFGRTLRVTRRVVEIAHELDSPNRWEYEIPAMLSQLGCVILPPATVERQYLGAPLSESERRMIERVPTASASLLASIPRLDGVRDVVRHQQRRYDGSDESSDGPRGDAIPLGARILKVALDLDALESQGLDEATAIRALANHAEWYDPRVLEALARQRGGPTHADQVVEMPLKKIAAGMIFEEDIRTTEGVLLVARGFAATPELLDRLLYLPSSCGIKSRLRVSRGSRAAAPRACEEVES